MSSPHSLTRALSEVPRGTPASVVIHQNVAQPPRCKITLKQLAKGQVGWEIEYAHDDPDEAARVVKEKHEQLTAEYGTITTSGSLDSLPY